MLEGARQVRLSVATKIQPILPNEEQYGLGNQLLRAGRSTTTNNAEGYGRFHCLLAIKFLRNARGSTWQDMDHLITAFDQNIIGQGLLDKGRQRVEIAARLNNAYVRYLNVKLVANISLRNGSPSTPHSRLSRLKPLAWV